MNADGEEVILKTYADFDKETLHYYNQRYSLFSKYDQGILMDRESWFSVTPEELAKYIAKRCQCSTIVDAFCGAGGNSIQFAKICDKVIAIDIDPIKIHCAINNAKIYGVLDKIEFIVGDVFEVIPALLDRQVDVQVLHMSPPWGGPQYRRNNNVNIDEMPINGVELYELAQTLTPNICFFMPRSVNQQQMIDLANHSMVELQYGYLNDRLKCMTIYYGSLANKSQKSLTEPRPQISKIYKRQKIIKE